MISQLFLRSIEIPQFSPWTLGIDKATTSMTSPAIEAGRFYEHLQDLCQILSVKEAFSSDPAKFGHALTRLFTLMAESGRLFHSCDPHELLDSVTINNVRANCSEYGAWFEKQIAQRILQRCRHITVSQIGRGHFGGIYNSLVQNDLYALGIPQSKTPSTPIVFVGCGAIPLSALVLARDHDCRVVCIDHDVEAIDLAQRITAQLGFTSRIRFVCQDAESWKFSNVEHVIFASWVSRIHAIIESIRRDSPRFLIARRGVPFRSLASLVQNVIESELFQAERLVQVRVSPMEPSTLLQSYGFAKADS
jgi:precorrin-6B methylase 2